MKKTDEDALTLTLVKNPDIVATIANLKQKPFTVGFAAESHDLLAHATAKRARKGVPVLVGNIGPETFGQNDNALLIVDAQGATEIPRNSKLALARLLVQNLAARLARQSA